MPKFWKFTNKKEDDGTEKTELRIQGDIVPDNDTWIYEWLEEDCASPNAFRDELNEHKGEDIDVWIDSYGGDVFAAAGIYNALKNHTGQVTVKIDGKAMSAASVIAMAGDKVMMSPTAILMIHNPLSAVQGYASDMRKQADVLDTIKESIVNAYQLKTGKPRKKISEMMDDETWMDANAAIKNGFADEMLYADDSKVQNKAINFCFNRLAIQNCAKNSLQKLANLQNKQQTRISNDQILEKLTKLENRIEALENMQKQNKKVKKQDNNRIDKVCAEAEAILQQSKILNKRKDDFND